MFLTPEEHERGLLKWPLSMQGARISTATAKKGEQPSDWSEPLTDPSGSLVESAPLQTVAVRRELEAGSEPESALPIFWERGFTRGIVTCVWDEWNQPQKLIRIPAFGFFHRLVIETPSLGWPTDWVVRNGDVMIRLLQGTVEGESVPAIDRIESGAGSLTLTGELAGSDEVTGSFVEIVAPGTDAQAAEHISYAILGYLAMFFGDHAIGRVIFSEPYHASPDGQFGTLRVPVTARFPRTIKEEDVAAADSRLDALLADDNMARARGLAFRWYEKGVRTASPLDALLSYYVGIEAIVNSFSSGNQTPEAAAREAEFQDRAKSLVDLSQASATLLKRKFIEPSAAERFRHYSKTKGWSDDNVTEYRRIAGIRNDALHGRIVEASEEDAAVAKNLLVRILRGEIGLTGRQPSTPEIHGLSVEYKVVFPDDPESETLHT